MLNTAREIAGIVASFHQGSIEGYTGNTDTLELRIACPFLASVDTKDSRYFYLLLQKVELFEFNNIDGENLTDIETIIDLQLEIGYAKVEEEVVIISCSIPGRRKENNSGELRISAHSSSIFIEERRQMKPIELFNLTKAYWKSKVN